MKMAGEMVWWSRIIVTTLLLLSVWETASFSAFKRERFGRKQHQHHVVAFRAIVSCRRMAEIQSEKDDDLWQGFLQRFQGDFDNYHQVVQDRKNGMEPREGGGHEHIHCTLVPLPEEYEDDRKRRILAAFYFDGMPQRIFRFRLYELQKQQEQQMSHENNSIDMKLYTLHPQLEGQLRCVAETPMAWPRIYTEFVTAPSADAADRRCDFLSEYVKNGTTVATQQPGHELKRCDVRWSREADPDQHTYFGDRDVDGGYHAVMVYGQAVVESTIVPGTMIRVVDQLSLWQDEFWIHDRGFDPDSGNYIYGNQRGVPYHLQRVTSIVSSQEEEERKVVNPDLQWTLGPKWRTEEEYKTRMAQIGGVSTRLNS